MNHQQAIEFVKSELDTPHYINESDCWYSCPLSTSDWHDGSGCCNDELPAVCNCGKEQRDVKLRELLQFLESACCFPNMAVYYEYWEEE